MYKDYYRLSEMPFSIAPDPRFLFMSDRHREALAHLLYGVQCEGGIVLLTGEVGTGKTTICRSLLEQLPRNVDVAFILNPRMSVAELLETICDEYHITVADQRRGLKGFVDAIHARLLDGNARGRRGLLIIDEAQNLDPLVVEQLRLLTNLETNTRKLLQIILIGQPELQDLLARPEMRQVVQRVVAHYHLTNLDLPEVKGYVAHRLLVAGAPPAIIPDSLIKPLYRATSGVPRLINLVCDRALLGTYTQGHRQVDRRTLRQAIREVVSIRQPRRRPQLSWALALLAGAAMVATSLLATLADDGWLPWRATTAAAVASTAEPAPTAIATVVLPPPSAPVAAMPAPLDRLEWPGHVPRTDSETIAFSNLFGLFGLRFEAAYGKEPCRQAEAFGLRCYFGHGGLSDLRLLDQPVLLPMRAADGHIYSVTLVGLERNVTRLRIADAERRVALADLADAWNGDFILLWRPTAGLADGLAPNQRSPAVAWLRASLARVDGLPAGSGDFFDTDLARRVRSFQLAEGLHPDGLVGPRTSIRLNVRSGAGGPRIAAESKD
jgi:general secretion pathway protein A